MHTCGRWCSTFVLAWVLWSKVNQIGQSGGWNNPVNHWQPVTGTTTERQCRDAQQQMIGALQGQGTPIPGGVLQSSASEIRRLTYECLPDTIDLRK